MKLVVVESPYAGDVERNLRYLRAAMADCLARGEAPFASHGLYPKRPEPRAVKVPLTRGYEATIDEADAERVLKHKWLAIGRKGAVYAARQQRIGGGRQLTIYMHRVLAEPGDREEVDHADGDRLNNRRSNLRCCDHSRNGRNSRRPTNNTSGFKGVSRERGGRWRASIVLSGKQVYIGGFDAADAAARAYDAKARELFGAFARLNFPVPEWDGVLDDTDPAQRTLGIRAGFLWGEAAELRVFYTDLGWSRGMQAGKDEAARLGQRVELRTLPGWASASEAA